MTKKWLDRLCLGSAIFAGLMLLTEQGCIPIPVPSSPPSPTTTAPVSEQAHENVSENGVQFQVERWWTTEQLHSYSGRYVYRPDPGKVFVIVTVRLSNNTGEREVFMERDFDLVGSDKRVYSARTLSVYEDKRVNRLSLELLDGGYGTGDIVYELDAGVVPVRVEYSAR